LLYNLFGFRYKIHVEGRDAYYVVLAPARIIDDNETTGFLGRALLVFPKRLASAEH